MLNYLLHPRYTLLDALWLSAVPAMFVQQKYLASLVILFMGPLLSVFLGHLYEMRTKKNEAAKAELIEAQLKQANDRLWQQQADAGHKVEAIRKYRFIYDCTLREALDAVEHYNTQRAIHD